LEEAIKKQAKAEHEKKAADEKHEIAIKAMAEKYEHDWQSARVAVSPCLLTHSHTHVLPTVC
jgi:hypothetical protein